jgi:D-alanine-D-alanine ligase
MKRVVVLAGGDSNEREVSLRSGDAVAGALRAKGYDVKIMDPRDGLEELGEPAAVFPALHGAGGEDGTIQATLESIGVPYVGSGVAASALCFDKWLYRQVLAAAGLPVADGAIVTTQTIWQSPLARQAFVLKPIQGGSSLDTFIVRGAANLNKKRVEQTLRRYGAMLMEKLIPGTELTVGVLSDEALPPVEIIPPGGGEFDYDNKYNGQTKELCPPQNVSTATQKRAQQLALKAHQIAGCRHLSRTDIIIDKRGRLYILETNTLPGMTGQSLYPKEATARGLTFPDLCDRLVGMALGG